MLVQGRLIVRERLVKETNQMVKFYSIHTLKGWAQVNFDKKVEMKKIEVPGLVEIDVVSARINTNTGDDGTVYKNKRFFATSCKNIESSPEFEEFEHNLLEEKINKQV